MQSLKEIFDKNVNYQPADVQLGGSFSTKKESWNDEFEEGSKYLKTKVLDVAERSFSRALKILCASPGRSLGLNKEKARCFQSLATLYLARASQQSKKEDFCEMVVKSVALSEAERYYKHGVYKEDEEINASILKAEVKLVENVFGSASVDRLKSKNDPRISNRLKLQKIRSHLTDKYFPKLDTCPEWGSPGERERCSEVESIYQNIHHDMHGFIREIFVYCSDIAGPAPCNYSMIWLGSPARKEGTQYSDLEFAILLGKNKNELDEEQRAYFRFLTYFIHLQIVKLGETILPSVGISSLNDFYSESHDGDWFYDDVVPKGFSFDGIMPWACKTPIGRKAWRGLGAQEYIMSVEEMLKLQDVTPQSTYGHLQTANVFNNVCHLFGDEKITAEYQKKLFHSVLTNENKRKLFQLQVLGVMKNLLETYVIDSLLSKNFGTQQDVKREVYRLTSLLVEQLSKLFGIFGLSSWQCIQELQQKKVLTPAGAENLLVALSITTELRLKCYHKHGMQKEALPTLPELVPFETGKAQNSNASAIIRLYQILLPLKAVVSKILYKSTEANDFSDVESLARCTLQDVNLNDVSLMTKAMAYLRILNLPKALILLNLAKDSIFADDEKVDVILVLAYCYRMVGKFQKALDCCREVRQLYAVAPNRIDKSDFLTAMITTMLTYMDLGLYSEALNMHSKIMTCPEILDFKYKSIDEELDFLNSSAVLFMKVEQYGKAEKILRQMIEKMPNPRKHYLNYFVCINNLAVILLENNRLGEAKTTLNDALVVAKELFGENTIHPYVACSLTNLSKVYFHLGNVEEANNSLQHALLIYHRVHDEKLIEPSIIDALITRAKACQLAGKWEEMYSSLLEAKEVCEILYGANFPHPNISSVHLLLGYCEEVRGTYTVALKHYQNSLKIREEHKIQCEKSQGSCEIASALLRMASLGKMCFQDSSYPLKLIEKALEEEEKVHGDGANHSHLAMCFSRLGYNLMIVSGGKQGVEYLEKARQIMHHLNLHDTHANGQVELLTGHVLKEVSPGKAEVHLRSAERIFKKTFKDDDNILLLEINSSLLKVFAKTNRFKEGLELAEVQNELVKTNLSKTSKHSLRQLYQLYWLASFYEISGKRKTARGLYTQLVSNLETLRVDLNDSDDNRLTFLLWIAQEALGTIYQGNEQFDEAEKLFYRLSGSIQKSKSQHAFVSEARFVAQWQLASIFIQTRRLPQAYNLLSTLISALEGNPDFNNAVLAASVYRRRGELHQLCSRLDLAKLDLKKAMEVVENFRETGDSSIMKTRATECYLKILNSLGLVYEQEGDVQQAFECYRKCVNVVQGHEPTMDTATFYQNAADTLKKLQRLDEALIHYNECLKIREKLHLEDPIREDIATVLYHIAETQFMQGRTKDASQTLEKLLPLRQELLKKAGLSTLQNYCAVLVLKGNCHIQQPEEAQNAKEAYEEAEIILKKMTGGHANLDSAMVASNIGCACQLLGECDEAISKFNQALQMKRDIYKGVKWSPEIALTCSLLAEMFVQLQKYEEALPYLEEALKIHQSNASTDEVAKCLLVISSCYEGLKKFDKAMEILVNIRDLRTTIKLNRKILWRFHKQMADVLTELEPQNISEVVFHLKEAESMLNEVKETGKDEETLNEVQAKILSLQL